MYGSLMSQLIVEYSWTNLCSVFKWSVIPYFFPNQTEPSAPAAEFAGWGGARQRIDSGASRAPELGATAAGAGAAETAADAAAAALPGEGLSAAEARGVPARGGSVNIPVSGDSLRARPGKVYSSRAWC